MSSLSLDYDPRPWQRQCHQAMRRFTVLALHRRAGKTELALMQLIDRALRFDLDLGLFFYVAPYLKQAKAIAWARLKQRLEPLSMSQAVEINESDLLVRFPHNGAVIRVFGADNPDAMRGVRLDGVVLDEVGQIKPTVWDDIIQPTLSDRKGWALFIGTPAGINLFSELYHKAVNLPDWHSARYTVYDTDALDPDEVARLRRDMSETSFAREYLCDFSAAGDDQIISLTQAEDSARRMFKPGEMDYAPRILGVDPARFGSDRSVIFPRQGLQAFAPEVYTGIDNMDLASRVAYKITTWRPDAVFVDSGAGAGVIDRLRQLGHDPVEVNFGGRPTDPGYANKRAEMWFLMADWVRTGAIPDLPELKQELATPTYWFDAQNRRQVEPKDDIKKRLHGGRSPDLADALALTFAEPVAKASMLQQARGRINPLDYDPIAEMSRGFAIR